MLTVLGACRGYSWIHIFSLCINPVPNHWHVFTDDVRAGGGVISLSVGSLIINTFLFSSFPQYNVFAYLFIYLFIPTIWSPPPPCLPPFLTLPISVLSNRPSVRRVSVEGKDPYVKSSSHTEGREAHDLWVPSASSGLWRHQSGVLPQTEQDDEEGKTLCKLWPVTTSQNHNLVGTSYHRILTSLLWLQRDVAFWCFVVFLLFYVSCYTKVSAASVAMCVLNVFFLNFSFFPQQSITVLCLFAFLCSI